MSEGVRAVFLFCRDGEPFAFPSVEQAARFMEAIDVDAGEYVALFTQDGRVITATTESRFDVVLTVTNEYDPERFHTLLHERVAHSGLHSRADDVLAIANELMRLEWEQRWPRRPRWLAKHLHGARPPQV